MVILKKNKPVVVPLIPLTNVVPFPHVDIPVMFGRIKSIKALMQAYKKDNLKESLVMAVAQKNVDEKDPQEKDLYLTGVLCRVGHVVRVDGTVYAVLHGITRAKILKFKKNKDYWEVYISTLKDKEVKDPEKINVLTGHLIRQVKKAFNLGQGFAPELLKMISRVNKLKVRYFVNLLSTDLDFGIEGKQKLLETFSLEEKLKILSEQLVNEINVLKLDRSIEKKTEDKFNKKMRQSVLEERKKEIDKELGKIGVESDRDDIKELRRKIKKAKLPKHVAKKVKKELKRLARMSPYAPNASYIHTYLEVVSELPWSKKTKTKFNLKKSEKTLENDHFGLDKAKERVLEHLGVMKLKKKRKQKKNGENGTNNILCFIGPPGVGKTSLGRSIARAMGRKFVRISLGGIRDEAEIRGHRRTYVGSLPGRIIQGIKDAEVNNPVFMLDEIDKVGTDFRGDPSAALLEVLDPDQNKEFSDHYLEIPFDLSDVFFILTGNITDTIPTPLLDRLEIIRFPGYTDYEKLKIAQKYLVPRQLKKHALTKKDLVFKKKVLKDVINKYTREAGVRELERMIAKISRKTALRVAQNNKIKPEINIRTSHRFLGPPQFQHQIRKQEDKVGVSTGLAWTRVGGEILFIEVATMPGKGELQLTGQLGDVMKESCQAALSYVRSNWKKLGVQDKNFAKKTDIHIHVPEGAVKKDGPSAGAAIATALVSRLTNVPIQREVGMTGEINLNGEVLKIGGVKEKIIAGHRAGLKTILLPKDNKLDLREVPKRVKKDIEFVFVNTIADVLPHVLKK